MSKATDLLSKFNDGLLDMRELFHQTGRLEDSNAKLDEVTKLLCLEIASARDSASKVPSLRTILKDWSNGPGLVAALNKALIAAAESSTLTNFDGESLLGPNPKFNLAESENELAKGLAEIVLNSFNGYLRGDQGDKSFEFLNEAFGHFIRDNFRQNIEDAQYMTPPEGVNFMVDLGISRLIQHLPKRRPIVCDPSCGVGSFLAQFYRAWTVEAKRSQKPLLIGQDKVDRMARLSLLNLALFGIEDAKIFRGNSMLPGSPLDQYFGKCDLILTNPPFGAKFSCTDLAPHSARFFTNLNNLIQTRNGAIDSELLFLDRYFSLLRPGGTLLAVLPDSVISSAGLPAILRDEIQCNYEIRSITELPAVTFAQAGTRTKTCILEVQKVSPTNRRVFMASATSLGYEVSSKKGVPYKKPSGENQLPDIYRKLVAEPQAKAHSGGFEVLAVVPSCVAIPKSVLSESGWTPSHYSADRLTTLSEVEGLSAKGDFDVVELDSLVSVASRSKKGVPRPQETKCISVLHVSDFGSLNISELLHYSPKTPGKHCQPGDLLFSKINPRIPRALVVPNLPFDLTCSTEFEVLRPKSGRSPHEIMLLLLSSMAQNQIRALTSGTSSSHNRIKTKELLSIKLAIPGTKSPKRKAYLEAVNKFTEANICLNKANIDLEQSWSGLNALFDSGS